MSTPVTVTKVAAPTGNLHKESAAEREREAWGGRAPSDSTLEALRELDEGRAHRSKSLEELWVDLRS